MEKYKIDLVNNTLIITAAFEEELQNPKSAEYKLFTKLQQDIPGLTVTRRTHKSPTKYHTASGEVLHCNQYKNLTYENMEQFMSGLRQKDELFTVYNYIKDHASLPQRSRYTAVRRWFAAQFPNFRKNSIFYYNKDITIITDIEPLITQVEPEARERKEEKAARAKEMEKKSA